MSDIRGYDVNHINKLEADIERLRAEIDEWKRQAASQSADAEAGEQRIAELESQQVWLYNQGYAQGHHDTVEGMYTDVLPCDMNTYHDDVVADLLAEALKDGDFAASQCDEKEHGS